MQRAERVVEGGVRHVTDVHALTHTVYRARGYFLRLQFTDAPAVHKKASCSHSVTAAHTTQTGVEPKMSCTKMCVCEGNEVC